MMTEANFQFVRIISLLIPLGFAISWIVLVIATWRFMKAHESIAQTYKSLEKFMHETIKSTKSEN